jgi:hypothetical protein
VAIFKGRAKGGPVPEEPTSDDDRDRLALEQIRGDVLPRNWPEGALPAGGRVQIIQDLAWSGPWAQGFSGRMGAMSAPEALEHQATLPWELEYWLSSMSRNSTARGRGSTGRPKSGVVTSKVSTRRADPTCL